MEGFGRLNLDFKGNVEKDGNYVEKLEKMCKKMSVK